MTKRELLINNLRNLILVITENSKKIENLKTSLYLNKLFDYTTFCNRLDPNSQLKITPLNFEKFLFSHTINPPRTLIKIFFDIYADKKSPNEKYFTYEGFNYFLYPKNYISSRITSIYSKNNLSFDLEEKVCNIIMHEFALINEVSKCLDLFYLNDDNFNIKDIINFFYDGKDGDVINDIHLEKFCMKYNINMTHNELRLLLFYLKADFHNIITYNKLKDFFTIFILDKVTINSELTNNFFNSTLKHYITCSLDKLNAYEINNTFNIDLNLTNFLKEFINLEYSLYNARKILYLCDDFIPIELFYIFDKNDKNKFSIIEFKEILSEYFCIEITIDEAEIIFYNYTSFKKNDNSFSNKNTCMNYQDFKKLILPYDCINLPEKIIQPEFSNLTNKTKSLIINFFYTLLNVEKQLDILKMNYYYKTNFSPYEEFIQLRGNDKKAKFINNIMLINYLEKNLNNDEKRDILIKNKINAFFNRFDKDKDMMISFSDFVINIEPFNSNI